jgi:hypothetical protein
MRDVPWMAVPMNLRSGWWWAISNQLSGTDLAG